MDQFLTALWEAVSWAIIPTKSPDKMETLTCVFSPQWTPPVDFVVVVVNWHYCGYRYMLHTCSKYFCSIWRGKWRECWKVWVLKEALWPTIVWPSGNLPVSTSVRWIPWWLKAWTLEPACLGLNVGLAPCDLCDLIQVRWTLCSLISERGIIIECN